MEHVAAKLNLALLLLSAIFATAKANNILCRRNDPATCKGTPTKLVEVDYAKWKTPRWQTRLEVNDGGNTTLTSGITRFAFGDVDGDGDADMLAIVASAHTEFDTCYSNLTFYENVAGSIPGTPPSWEPREASYGIGDLSGIPESMYEPLHDGDADRVNCDSTISLVDYDKDGDLDIVSAKGNDAYSFKNIGNSTQATWVVEELSTMWEIKISVNGHGYPMPRELVLADMDTDGDLDAFSWQSSGVFFYHNNATEVFNPDLRQTYSGGGSRRLSEYAKPQCCAGGLCEDDEEGLKDAVLALYPTHARPPRHSISCEILTSTSTYERVSTSAKAIIKMHCPMSCELCNTVTKCDDEISPVGGESAAGESPDESCAIGFERTATGCTDVEGCSIEGCGLGAACSGDNATNSRDCTCPNGVAGTATGIPDNVRHADCRSSEINFVDGQKTMALSAVSSVVLSDVDNDGDLDMLIGTNGNSRSIGMENTGSRRDPAWTQRPEGLAKWIGLDPSEIPGVVLQMQHIDLDLDGLDDFVWYGDYPPKLKIFRRAKVVGPDHFVARTEWALANEEFSVVRPIRPAGVDLNGDGHQDLVVHTLNWPEGHLIYYQRKADVERTTGIEYELPLDLKDKDGADIYVVDFIDGSNGFDTIYHEGLYPAFIDIDQDTDFDLILGTGTKGIVYYENTGVSPNTPRLERRASWLNHVCPPRDGADAIYGHECRANIARFDGDASMDVGVIQSNGKLKIYQRANATTFVRNSSLDASSDPSGQDSLANSFEEGGTGIAFGDVDNDGDDDAIMGNSDGTLEYFERTALSPPEWTKVADWSLAGISVGSDAMPALLDYDSDGDLDLIVGTQAGKLFLFEMSTCATDCTTSGECNLGSAAFPTCACSFEGGTANSSCNSCNGGYYFKPSDAAGVGSVDGSDAGTCRSCGPGQYGKFAETRQPKSTTCSACAPGKYQGDEASDACAVCPIGWHQKGSEFKYCFACVPGKYQDQEGTSECKPCATNAFSDSTATNCSLCAAGRFSGGNAAACIDCPAGTRGLQRGQGCVECVAGRYREGASTDLTSCSRCPEGYSQPGNGTTFCLGCDAGKYADVKGSAHCTLCPKGKVVPDKRSTSISTCQPCKVEGDIPNELRSECVNAASATGLGGIPAKLQQRTEGSTYTYPVKMNSRPAQGVVVTVTVAATLQTRKSRRLFSAAAPPPCSILDGKNTITFTHDNYDQEQNIAIVTKDDGEAFAKDAISYECAIIHTLVSSDGAEYSPRSFTLAVASAGCGSGEFLGKHDRGANGTKCVCALNYFSVPDADCTPCPPKASECLELGMTAPRVKPGYWRADPTSPDLDAIPFYKCNPPKSCIGGNDTAGRCAPGFDVNSSTPCAVCMRGHVLSGGACVKCEGANSGGGAASPPLLGLVGFGALCYLLGTVYFLSRSAITKEKQKLITRALSRTELVSTDTELDRKRFSAIMVKRGGDDLHLTPRETELLFAEIDTDNSGTISREELEAYATAHQVSTKKGTQRKTKKNKKGAETAEKHSASLSAAGLDNIISNGGGVGVGGGAGEGGEMSSGKAKLQAAVKRISMSRSFLENPPDATPDGLSGQINASSGLKNTISAVDLSNVQVPELSLATFPGICLPQLSSDAIRTACLIKLPSFNLSEFPGIDLPSLGDIDSSALAGLSFPAITLADFPGLDLASFPALPSVDWTAVDLPKINLGDFPGLSLPGMPSFGTLPQLAAHALPEITVPPLDLFDFPGFQIPEGLSLEDLELLKAVKLPAIKLGDWPDIDLPSLSPIGLDGTDIDLSDFFIRLDNVAKLELPEMDLPSFPGVSLPSVSVDWSTVRLPRIKSLGVAFPDLELPGDLPNMAAFGDMFDFDLDVGMDLNLDVVSVRMPSGLGMDTINALDLKIPKLRLDMGGSLMKIKLFLGFTQCVSFFPVTFATIPWPENFLSLGNFLKLFAVDLFALFGSAACNLSTGFYDQFLFSFFLMPLIIVGASLAYMAVLAKKKSAGNNASFTAESARVRLYTMLFMIVYTLYTSVATKLFVLFKCVQIQDTWYLAADMRIVCFDATYQTYRMMSFLGIALYVVGIPAVIFMMLFRRRTWLHEEGCPKGEMYKHVQVEKSFGSVYKDYTPNNYYFDLLDLGRRLLLTGGLILVGEESNTQIFLGLLLNVMWLVLVLFRRPYKAYWDNILSIVLSFQLVMVMLCGNALELNRLNPAKKDDVYEESSFGMLMVVFTVFIVATGFVSLIISVPCLRERIVRCYAAQYTTVGEKEGGDDDDDDGGETEENTTKKKKRKKKTKGTKMVERSVELTDLSTVQNEKGGQKAATKSSAQDQDASLDIRNWCSPSDA